MAQGLARSLSTVSIDDWFDYRLENDERFLRKIARARDDMRAGRFVTLENLEREEANKQLRRAAHPQRVRRR